MMVLTLCMISTVATAAEKKKKKAPTYEGASDSAKLAESFEKFITTTMTEVIGTYEGIHFTLHPCEDGICLKSSNHIDPNYKYDLEKTTSLISPYVGTLKVNGKQEWYRVFPNSDQGEFHFSDPEKLNYVITFVPKKGKWEVLNGKYNGGNRWVDLEPGTALLALQCPDKTKI
jgi:hypothetical protein